MSRSILVITCSNAHQKQLKFENDMLVYDNPFDLDWLLNSLDDYVFPVRLASFPYKEVWNRLEEDRTTIRHVITQEEFEQLQAETDVMMDFDAAGKLIYMASQRPECIDRAKAKLMVLWEYSVCVLSSSSETWDLADVVEETAGEPARASLV